MTVPPSPTAANSTAPVLVSKALAPTPRLSARQAAENALQSPYRRSSQSQKATDGIAATPTISHTTASRVAISGVVLTS